MIVATIAFRTLRAKRLLLLFVLPPLAQPVWLVWPSSPRLVDPSRYTASKRYKKWPASCGIFLERVFGMFSQNLDSSIEQSGRQTQLIPGILTGILRFLPRE
ncbi:hypothetical protein RIEGSTA812A_PEG_1230 [invertebrate metagenome]|uniref:Uncharacterized protein n=1 Tax=invertebrate metagenome TaxID=1711999 RepID=A0A484H6I0_9ZZZZ